MKIFYTRFLLLLVSLTGISYAQTTKLDKVQFFTDTSTLPVKLVTNMNRLLANNKKDGYFPANFITRLPDGTEVNEPIRLEFRGHFRRSFCYMPPIKLNFNNPASPVLRTLGSLKLVCACKTFDVYDQYLIREYLIYKIYNLLTDKSFRVRLLDITYQDSSGKKKDLLQHAFLIEDIKDLAKRNKYREWNKSKVNTESTERQQMTLVALFEYMIGNTDWAVPVNHNIKLIQPKNDSTALPEVVPYDFDYSGLVNTDYAVPDEKLEIENVRQRLYRGFPRSIEELTETLQLFKQQKENIYAIINNCPLLKKYNKQDMIDYLNDFYKIIENKNEVQSIFITNARTR